MQKILVVLLMIGLMTSCAAYAQEPAKKELTDDQIREVREQLDLAETNIANKKYVEAGNNVLKVLQIVKGIEEYEAKANKLAEQLTKIADDLFKEAEGKETTDPIAALEIYSGLQAWSFNEIRRKAKAAAETFRMDEKKKGLLEKAYLEIAAKKRFETTVKPMLDRKMYGQAYTSLLSIIASYPGTKTAEEAAAKIKELMADKDIAASIESQKRQDIAKAFEQLANVYDSYNNKEEALELYKLICEKYPDTPQARYIKAKLEREKDKK